MNTHSALAGLIGQYGSGDSSGGEDNCEDLNPSALPVVPEQQLGVWSMCVDPATGCPYYWEQVTNQVCWEPPPGFIPVPVTIPSNVSKNRVVSAAMKSSQEKNLEARRSAKKPVTKSLRQKSPSSEEDEKIELITSYYNSESGSDEENRAEAKLKSVVRVYPRNAGKKRKNTSPPNLIYDDSSSFKKTKKIISSETLIYGPELPKNVIDSPVYGPSLPDSTADLGSQIPSVKNNSEIEPVDAAIIDDSKKTDVTSSIIVESVPEDVAYAPEKEPIVINQDEIGNVIVNNGDSVENEVVSTELNGVDAIAVIPESNTEVTAKNKITYTVENTDEIDNKSSSDLETENLDETVMDKLMVTQAKLLKKLGELVPSEIKYLVGSPKIVSVVNSTTQSPRGSSPTESGSPAPKNSAALDMDVDDLIAQIEMEQPIDQPSTASDGVSVGTVCSRDESITSKSVMVLEDTSDSKPEELFKPLFPSAVRVDSAEYSVESKTLDLIVESDDVVPTADSIQPVDVTENIFVPASEVTKVNDGVDVKVFNKYEMNAEDLGIESAAFKRKRRIAIDVLPGKKAEVQPAAEFYSKRDLNYTTKYSENFQVSGGRMGLGFKRDFPENDFDQDTEVKKTNYSNFKSGGILFQKGESLLPDVEKTNNASEGDSIKDGDDLERQKELIEAKLKFLTQSLPPVAPMQQLSIELQTLWGAWGSGALLAWRLRDWLDTAGSALARLETKAAPPPWTCRFHRYTYSTTSATTCSRSVHPPPAEYPFCIF